MKDLLTRFIVFELNGVILMTFGKVEHSAYSTAGKEVFSIPCPFIFLRQSGLV